MPRFRLKFRPAVALRDASMRIQAMNNSRLVLASAFTLWMGSPALADNTTKSAIDDSTSTEWAIDAAHAHVGFSVPHMVVSEVEGKFKAFSGKVLLNERDLTKSQVELTVQVASIDTDNADRDKHLRSGDFFDAEKFPNIEFKSTKITRSGKGYKVTGQLRMRGVTKQITLDAAVSEAIVNPWGKQVRAVKLGAKINRQDFGVSWNKALDKGGMVVGDQVTLNVRLELNR
jgi:polyisoprenoid-binding protein YceI